MGKESSYQNVPQQYFGNIVTQVEQNRNNNHRAVSGLDEAVEREKEQSSDIADQLGERVAIICEYYLSFL